MNQITYSVKKKKINKTYENLQSRDTCMTHGRTKNVWPIDLIKLSNYTRWHEDTVVSRFTTDEKSYAFDLQRGIVFHTICINVMNVLSRLA